MPFLADDDIPLAEVLTGVRARRVVDHARGSASATLGEMEIDPGGGLPLHRHLVEEVVVVLEGTGRLTIDGHAVEVARGSVHVAPAGSPHMLENSGRALLRILFFFPSVNVERYWVDQGT
jgi:quercetin dioxygenase-like cupin family protein